MPQDSYHVESGARSGLSYTVRVLGADRIDRDAPEREPYALINVEMEVTLGGRDFHTFAQRGSDGRWTAIDPIDGVSQELREELRAIAAYGDVAGGDIHPEFLEEELLPIAKEHGDAMLASHDLEAHVSRHLAPEIISDTALATLEACAETRFREGSGEAEAVERVLEEGFRHGGADTYLLDEEFRESGEPDVAEVSRDEILDAVAEVARQELATRQWSRQEGQELLDHSTHAGREADTGYGR